MAAGPWGARVRRHGRVGSDARLQACGIAPCSMLLLEMRHADAIYLLLFLFMSPCHAPYKGALRRRRAGGGTSDRPPSASHLILVFFALGVLKRNWTSLQTPEPSSLLPPAPPPPPPPPTQPFPSILTAVPSSRAPLLYHMGCRSCGTVKCGEPVAKCAPNKLSGTARQQLVPRVPPLLAALILKFGQRAHAQATMAVARLAHKADLGRPRGLHPLVAGLLTLSLVLLLCVSCIGTVNSSDWSAGCSLAVYIVPPLGHRSATSNCTECHLLLLTLQWRADVKQSVTRGLDRFHHCLATAPPTSPTPGNNSGAAAGAGGNSSVAAADGSGNSSGNSSGAGSAAWLVSSNSASSARPPGFDPVPAGNSSADVAVCLPVLGTLHRWLC